MAPRKFTGSEFLPGHLSGPGAPHCEINRLKTYAEWSDDFPSFAITLAKHGFYYTGRRDCVQCTFCGFTKSDWTAVDKPGEVHRAQSPSCPLYDVNNSSPLRGPSNVPIPVIRINNPNLVICGDSSSSARASTEHGSVQPANSNSSDIDIQAARIYNDIGVVLRETSSTPQQTSPVAQQPVNPAQNAVAVSGARYPEYSCPEKRLHSFQRCRQFPAQICRAPLSDSGFFPAGYGADDLVICFHCGLMLCQWDPADIPDIEHARHRPSCPFLAESRGRRFIRRVQNEVATVGSAR